MGARNRPPGGAGTSAARRAEVVGLVQDELAREDPGRYGRLRGRPWYYRELPDGSGSIAGFGSSAIVTAPATSFRDLLGEWLRWL